MKKKFKMFFVVAALLLIAFSCTMPTAQNSVVNDFETFLAENKMEKDGDEYLYDGDVFFSAEEVERLYNEYKSGGAENVDSKGNIAIDRSTNARYVWTAAQKRNITYQFATSMATGRLTDAQVRSAFRAAAAAWNSAADVRFVEVSSSPVFTVRTVNVSTGYTAASFFPNSTYEHSLRVNLRYVDRTYDTYAEMVGLFTHELGHSLGLAHEHQRSDAPDHHGQGTYGEAYGNYDAQSVMNYGSRPYTSGISTGDRTLVQHLYDSQYFTFPNALATSGYGYSSGGWRIDQHPRMIADVNGDGRDDIVGFANAGVAVALGTSSGGVSYKGIVLSSFGQTAGGWKVNEHPRMMADVNGDGRDDIVGFGNSGVYVALGTSTGRFTMKGLVLSSYGYTAGGWRVNQHPRMMGDVNGDGRADIVGFANAGVYVALGTSTGGFSYKGRVVSNFGYSAGGWRVNEHPRMLADINGDGRDDIVGFANAGVAVALGTSSGGFTYKGLVLDKFGAVDGWKISQHPRMMADINGDGRADVVGFANAGVYVALGTSTGGFSYKGRVVSNFGYSAGGWRVDKHPRMMADINGDGRDDIVGFGNAGVIVALGTSSGAFSNPYTALAAYGQENGGWRVSQHPRMTGDINGDKKADIIGFGNAGTYISRSRY